MRNVGFAMVTIGVLLACSGCWRTSPSLADPEPDPLALLNDSSGELIEESWAAHLVRGAKVGHRHTRVFRLEKSAPALLRIVTVDRLELRRFGHGTVQVLTTASLETEDGHVRQLAYQVDNGGSTEQAGGIVRDGYLLLTRAAHEAAEPTRIAWSKRQQGIFAVERTLRRKPLAPGDRRSIETFLPLLDRVAPLELVVQRHETVDVDGQPRTLLRVEAMDPRAEGWQLPTVYWVDDDGVIIKTQESFMDRETLAVDQSRATRPNDTLRPDMGIDVGVRVQQPIDNARYVNNAVYRVQVEGLDPQKLFPSSLSQRVSPTERGVVEVTVSRVTAEDPPPPDIRPRPPQPDDLAPSPLVQSDHPRIKAIAESVAGSVDDPWFAAQLLERHVHGRLNKVDFSQVFGSAAEVAEQKRGDCSEHAVLLAAVCRARGIPARVAVGLLYSEEQQSFLFHMWNEVWIRDRWLPLDATLGEGGTGACHLKLRDSSLAHETAYSMVAPVMHVIGRTKIDVVAIESSRLTP
jgi:transglutaminase-like putative cysteine protease